jgi:NitT/TauT family transport system substrate-binding protein
MLNRRTKLTTTSRGAAQALLAGLVACVLVLSACAGNPNASGSAATTNASGALHIKMRSTGPTFTDLPTVVILAQDYFKKVGLDADFEFISASNAATATQGLIAGEMDVASGGTGSVYSAYAQGAKDLVSLGTVNPAMTFGLAVNNETAKQMAAKGVTPDSPVEQRVQALKGMSLASSPQGSTGQKYLKTMLSTYGVDPNKDVTLVPNADNAAQLAAAKQGRVNGFANSFPNTNLPEADGWGVLWLNFAKDLPQILPLAAHEVYTSRKWLDKNPEAAKRLMKAYWLALADLQNPTPELKDKIKNMEGFKKLNPKGFDLGWELSVPVYKGATPVTTEQMYKNQLNLVNLERKGAPVNFKMDDLYDLKAAEESKP